MTESTQDYVPAPVSCVRVPRTEASSRTKQPCTQVCIHYNVFKCAI